MLYAIKEKKKKIMGLKWPLELILFLLLIVVQIANSDEYNNSVSVINESNELNTSNIGYLSITGGLIFSIVYNLSIIGGLIFSISTAFFAIKTSYYDKILDENNRRYNSLNDLYSILSSLERFRSETRETLTGIGTIMGGAHYTVKVRTRNDEELLNFVNDAAFLNLINNLPSTDQNELGITNKNLIDSKATLYRNKDEFPRLIQAAKKDYQNECNRRMNKINGKHLVYMMAFGIILEIISYLV